MSKTIRIPFPIGGYDAHWGFDDQPKLTTPSASNVRPYDVSAERARGGSRPGIGEAYSATIGASAPVQWLGWMDYGYGDTVIYDEKFDLPATGNSVLTRATWTGSTTGLRTTGGYAYLSSAPASGDGAYIGFAGDTWNDFELFADVFFSWGCQGSATLWVSSASQSATDGAKLVITKSPTHIPWPGLGFDTQLSFALSSGTNSANKVYWFGFVYDPQRVAVRIIADEKRVRLEYEGSEILSVARDDGTCDEAGFAISKALPTGTSSSNLVVQTLVDRWQLTAVTRATQIEKKLVAIGNRAVWAETDAGGTFGASAADTDTLANYNLYSAASVNGKLCIATGATGYVYNPMDASNKVQALTAREGALEQDCRGVVGWRGRAVWFSTPKEPWNWFASRVGDVYDYDYGQDDAEAAVAGNLSDGCRIADPIIAMCPINEDVCVVGCSRSIWVIRGDPKAGGFAYRLTDQVGMLGPNAWTTDDRGVLYFLGETGLYRMTANSPPESLTDQRIPDLDGYRSVPAGTSAAAGQHYATLAYDAERGGVLVFLTPYGSTAPTHYFLDLRTKSFWPETYPIGQGPTTAAYYNSNNPTYRQLVLGGRDGRLYRYSDAQKYDHRAAGGSVAITSHVVYTPERYGGGMGDAVMSKLVGTLGQDSDAVQYGILAADTMEELAGQSAGDALVGGTWTAGRNIPERTRVRGGALGILLHNDTINTAWAAESIYADILAGGEQR